MKRLKITILLSCIMLYGCTKEYTEMDVVSSHNSTSNNWYKLNIDVIADKETVSNKTPVPGKSYSISLTMISIVSAFRLI